MQVMLMRLSKIEYLIVPKGTKFTGLDKLRLNHMCKIILTKKFVEVQSCNPREVRFYLYGNIFSEILAHNHAKGLYLNY